MIAGSPDTAIVAARDIGYPVVLKLLAAEVQHKSDIGGVMLNIRGDAELRNAYARLGAKSRRRGPARSLSR